MHYISDSDAANRPQTRINKGSVLFAILQTVEDGLDQTRYDQEKHHFDENDAN